MTITDAQRQRLDVALKKILEANQHVSTSRLRAMANVGQTAAAAYKAEYEEKTEAERSVPPVPEDCDYAEAFASFLEAVWPLAYKAAYARLEERLTEQAKAIDALDSKVVEAEERSCTLSESLEDAEERLERAVESEKEALAAAKTSEAHAKRSLKQATEAEARVARLEGILEARDTAIAERDARIAALEEGGLTPDLVKQLVARLDASEKQAPKASASRTKGKQ